MTLLFDRVSQAVRSRRTVLLLFCLAALVRVSVVVAWGPQLLAVSSDAQAYNDLGVNVATRHLFITGHDPPHRLDYAYIQRPPLTPMLMAVTYILFGVRHQAGQVVLSLVGAAACVGIYMVAHQLFNPLVAAVAGFIAVFYPFFVFLSVLPLTENLAMFLYVLLAFFLLRALQEPRAWRRGAVLGGIILGLAALNKPTALGLLPFLLVWSLMAFWPECKLALRVFGVIVAMCGLTISPWLLRNYFVAHEFVPISRQLWFNFYQGNSPHTAYSLGALENGATGWVYSPDYGKAFGGVSSDKAETEMRDLAFQFIREHPGEVIRLVLWKLKIFWEAYPHPLHRLTWFPVFGLSILGVLLTFRHWKKLLIVYLMILGTVLLPVFFQSLPRYRAPIEPFLIMFASYAVLAAVRAAYRMNFRTQPK